MATSQTADRVLEALFMLAEIEEVSLADVARRLHVSKSTAFNLLHTLEKHHLTVRTPATRRWHLGPGVFRLTNGSSTGLDLRRAARPHMERLRDITGETVSLHVRAGWERVCVERFESQHALRRSANVGEHWPLHSGSTGWVLMAWEAPASIERFLANAPFPPLTSRTLTDEKHLRAVLARTREQEYAITPDDPIENVGAVCMPVWDRAGVVAALSVSGPLVRWSVAELERQLPAVLAAAAEISTTLGYHAPAGDLSLSPIPVTAAPRRGAKRRIPIAPAAVG